MKACALLGLSDLVGSVFANADYSVTTNRFRFVDRIRIVLDV
jgi:hypothetical protein